MFAGMLPMALGFGEGGDQSAPLGRAVIGGLVAATCATLFVLPPVFAILQRRATRASASLDATDPESAHIDPSSRTTSRRKSSQTHVCPVEAVMNPKSSLL